MTKLLGVTAFAVFVSVAVVIASLVLNIIILGRVSNINNNISNSSGYVDTTPSPVVTVPPPVANDTKFCPNVGPASTSPAYKAAAAYLLNGLDQSIDPCVDFYAFTCNKFIAQVNLTALNMNRLGTYDQAQSQVNAQIVASLKTVDVNDDKKWSETERITKAVLDACVINSNLQNSLDNSKQILSDLTTWFGGVPFLGGTISKNANIWATIGTIEQTHALGTLLASWVSVDYRNVSQNALYVSQPSLSMPREFYVLPQFVDKLNGRAQKIEKMMLYFAKDVLADPKPYYDRIKQASHDVANFEVQIAMASWPDDEMRNYDQQYNAYNLDALKKAYPSVGWSDYLQNLLSSVEKAGDVANNQVVLSQPSYFAWLNAIFAGNTVDQNTLVNYIITQLLFDDSNFLGGSMSEVVRDADYVAYAQRRGRGVSRVGRRHSRKFDDQDDPAIGCMDMIMTYMPYGPGYVYVKSQENRADVVKDITHQTELVIANFQKMIGTLDWMTADSKAAAKYKSDHIFKNYGWPADLYQDFKNSTNVDDYHRADYFPIIAAYNKNMTDFYTILNLLKKGLENREAFRLLTVDADRWNFLQSPAMVNAWYQPERNSITFPYAIWNPPYYNLQYPQAYNYAGQGGTGGHELTHGFDDEGVQFGWDGSLTNCTWNQCGWMDTTSKTGFTDMAQCVVTQYSTQCCPEKTGNVHCCNGATTQGENIADLGGQQAAYNAYQDYVKELGHDEMRLPGLEQYTPNQIFWITYGYSWCMKQNDQNLVNQLLTNPHAPGSCRTNQVMQDIPSFGKDFGCKPGSPMYPPPDQRSVVVASLLLVVASLVLSILTFAQINGDGWQLPTENVKDESVPNVVRIENHQGLAKSLEECEAKRSEETLLPEPIYVNSSIFCPTYAPANNSPAWKEAARILREGLDQEQDPCKDFYAFTCNKFLSDLDIDESKIGRIQTTDLAQTEVYAAIAQALEEVNVNDNKWSETERITKAAYDACMISKRRKYKQNASKELYQYLKTLNVNVPFFNETLSKDLDIFAAIGAIEKTFGFGTLMQTTVDVDYRNITQNILYISQPILPLPRDLFVLPHNRGYRDNRSGDMAFVLSVFSMELVENFWETEELIHAARLEIADLEVQIAKASSPEREMGRHAEQYNLYTLRSLEKTYPYIGWRSYLKSYLSLEDLDESAFGKVVIKQPSYFSWLNSMLAAQDFQKRVLVNYLIALLVLDNRDFVNKPEKNDKQSVHHSTFPQSSIYPHQRIVNSDPTKIEGLNDESTQCMDILVTYLPFGAGYVYIKSLPSRDKLLEEVKNYTNLMMQSFQDIIKHQRWMTPETKEIALEKANKIQNNLGWPHELFADFKDSTEIDSCHRGDYYSIIDAYNKNKEDFYTIMKILKTDLKNREEIRKLSEKPNRRRFSYSPAKVQINYEYERNSITIPLASFVSILYNSDFPKAYTIASRGIAISRELSKAFDDEGSQFDVDGSLYGTSRSTNSWMDLESEVGHFKMRECVIPQYSSQCCRKESYMLQYNRTRCANGENSHRQNIADSVGLIAAYETFKQYEEGVNEEELRLPRLEQYTPNQIFWMTYGNSLCTRQSAPSLAVEYQTASHSPSECRVNLALRNIPEFANDFGCAPLSEMAPAPRKRCLIWKEEW
ncbi:hypothetical protein Y032_0001g221 [Ancylostoma ceylanicum]|uniref:Peptidase family M13 n=1 Tax=Ancylostoma ceylanicum TaxID=53326 RepID=A0A016W511_9BILA|nr:hypothetical protein Y032_0001g221 [Ancylostoma ceylanicum]